MSQDKKHVSNVIVFMLVLFLVILTFDWLLYHKIINTNHENMVSAGFYDLYTKLIPDMLMYRAMYVVIFCGSCYLTPSLKINKNDTKTQRVYYHIGSLIGATIIILGFYKTPHLYSLILYPILFLLGSYCFIKSFGKFRQSNIGDNLLLGASCEDANEMSFEFDVLVGESLTIKKNEEKTIRIHSPQQGIYVEGGAGAGKSVSIIEPILYQACMKGYSGLIYDFKGNPPTLSRTVYNSLLKAKYSKDEKPVNFAFINFVNMAQTVRVNPFSSKYLTSSLHVTEAATTLMLNLEKSWIEKRDFWANTAIAILDATMRYFRKHHNDMCTLPHVVTAILSNYEALLGFLSQDEDIKKVIASIIVAFEQNAGSQLAGSFASVQVPLVKLNDENIFWVLSKDEFSLDINNKKNPSMLCLANDPSLMEALSPCIGLIISVTMQQMNQQGKQKSIFCIDELPTIFINKLDNLPATARSNKVVTCLSVQSYAQLRRDYGDKNAEVIVGNLGTQFYGMTNEEKTAKRIVDMYGEYDYEDTSNSESESGSSESTSTKHRKIFQMRDIQGQEIGVFTGKIAGGKPPLFHAQFPYQDILKQLTGTIPLFALENLPIKSESEATNIKMLNSMVKANFIKINMEVEALLAPFQPVSVTDEEEE